MNDLPRVPRNINGRIVMVTLCPPRAAMGAMPLSLSPIEDELPFGDAFHERERRQGPCDDDSERTTSVDGDARELEEVFLSRPLRLHPEPISAARFDQDARDRARREASYVGY